MNYLRRIVSVLLTLAIVFSMGSVAFAEDSESSSGGAPITASQGGTVTTSQSSFGTFFNNGNTGAKSNEGLQKVSGTVLGYIRFIGYAIAIGMILYIGIKYMMSSAADKADLKKGAINYVIGAFLVAGATTIVTMIINAADGL